MEIVSTLVGLAGSLANTLKFGIKQLLDFKSCYILCCLLSDMFVSFI